MKRSAEPNSDKMKTEFRQKLENYKAAPSDNLWDKIELSLDKEEALVYKNRFRTYARLAAACLAFLIAFSFFLIPKNWDRFREQQMPVAVVPQQVEQPAQTVPATQPETVQPAQTKASEKTVAQQLPAAASPKKLTGLNMTAAENTETVALEPQKPTRTRKLAVRKVWPNQPQETGLIAISKTETPTQTSETKTAADLPKTENTRKALAVNTPETSLAFQNQPEQPNTTGQNDETKLAATRMTTKPDAANTAVSDPASAEGRTLANGAFGKVLSEEVALEISKAHPNSFTAPNPTVSEDAAKNNVAFSGEKPAEIPQAEPEKMVADKTLLAESTSEEEKPEAPDNSWKKGGRWVVSGGYAASNFSSGIKLSAHPYGQEGTGNTHYQEENMANYQNAIREYNQETTPAYSQAGAFAVGFKLARKWFLQTGLQYAFNREQTKSSYAFSRSSLSSSPGMVGANGGFQGQSTLQTVLTNDFEPANTRVTPEPEFTTEYRYEYFGVPLNLRFQTDGPDLYYFAGTGISVNWLTGSTLETSYDQPASTLHSAKVNVKDNSLESNFFRNPLLAMQVQTGVGYHFSPRWQAELALTGNQYLQSLLRPELAAGTRQQLAKNYGATLNLGYTF